MEIYDIKINEIADQYIEYLNQMEEMNLDIASEFLIMASTLIYLKSKSLLPKQDEERMIFPTFFLDIKNIEYTMSRDGLSLYTLIKNKGSYSESKKCFSILMENRKIRFKLCK